MITSCATYNRKSDIREEMQDITVGELEEKKIELNSVLINKFKTILDKSDKFTHVQKVNALVEYQKTLEKVKNLEIDFNKKKIVLFNHLATEEYDSDKIKVLRSEMKKNNEKRLKEIFSGLKFVKKHLGKEFKMARDIILDREIDLFYPSRSNRQ